MKNGILAYIIAVILVILIIVGGVFFINKSTANSEEKIPEKAKQELEYVEEIIISMINSLNNLHETDIAKIQTTINTNDEKKDDSESNSKENSDKQSEGESSSSENTQEENKNFSAGINSILLRDRNTIDWERLTKTAEELFSAWATITMDLNSLNVNSDNILAFNNYLDELLTSLKNQDKTNSEVNLANLYNLIPVYAEKITQDENELKILKIKANVISAYSIVEAQNWEYVNNFLAEADKGLLELTTSIDVSSSIEQAKINKSYILLKELIKSANEQDMDIFYLKYINLINELKNI